MRITAREQAEPLTRPAAGWGWCVGLLPDAPPSAVCWLKPLTVDAAIACHNGAAINLGADFDDTDGDRAIVAASLHIDPDAWLLTDGAAEPEPANLARMIPVFDSPEEVGDISLLMTDGAVDVTPGLALLMAVLQASGYSDAAVTEPDGSDPRAWREAVKWRGRWVGDLRADCAGLEVYVRPYTEAARSAASMACRTLGPVNQIAVMSHLLAGCVTAGPGGPPLLTREQVKLLPYGTARRMFVEATNLAGGGRTAGVRFRAVAPPALDDAGGRSGADVVDSREVAPSAVGDDG